MLYYILLEKYRLDFVLSNVFLSVLSLNLFLESEFETSFNVSMCIFSKD